ncbi:Similar to style development-specific protein 9612 precursor gb/X55193 and pectate lyase P59 precursor gb/X15499 from Lycopersicon esculentum [Arabidopsis thaliana]|nr:Similar to style development-specific protein 9612 precursor gb/X55193 and pectate lyase P59 precursor gb/X15499 from Lycopersicon esculentum [Arabidopsis thaliana]
MASLFLTIISLLFAAFSSSVVEAAYSNGYTIPKLLPNPIDSCWRRNPYWASNRRALADCAVGFGKSAVGGKYGSIYVVTNPSDDPENPRPGTLRYAVIQSKPLWITFARDMVIVLRNELIMNSYKTIDGRGAKVEIAYGPCITIQHVSHVIIHGISIHDCKPGKSGRVRSSPTHVGSRKGSDGDAIAIFDSSHIWIDHCFFSRCQDGLIDVLHASTAVTISNNYFTQHDKVMLLGHNDNNVEDKIMRVTIAFNHFGPGLIERMPRVRRGYAHVANNRYEKWQMYAIGGSADPTIFSEGNYFVASDDPSKKQVSSFKIVTKRIDSGYDWKRWKWRTSKDVFKNGAYFVPSGYGTVTPLYGRAERFPVSHGSLVPLLTSSAGPLHCYSGRIC